MRKLATKRRLAAIAAGLLVSWIASIATVLVGVFFRGLPNLVGLLPFPRDWWGEYLATGVVFTPAVLLGLSVGTAIAGHLARVNEPRCRECGYILRGLSEPRCPECGTPI